MKDILSQPPNIWTPICGCSFSSQILINCVYGLIPSCGNTPGYKLAEEQIRMVLSWLVAVGEAAMGAAAAEEEEEQVVELQLKHRL